MKNIVVATIGIISFVYLLNPSAGFIEFIPDNFPLLGNLDEAGATVLLLSAFKYFGVDIRSIFNVKGDAKDIAGKQSKD